jgi:hypothetical protein
MTEKHPALLETWDAVEQFMFAGAAHFTLVSLRTGVRFTYKVRVKKSDVVRGVAPDQVTYFINLLRGPDNTANFTYIGVLRRFPARFFWTAASGRVSRDAPSFKALMYLLACMASKRTGVLGNTLQVWHEGRCGCCWRLLTVDSSIRSGFGPICDARRAA